MNGVGRDADLDLPRSLDLDRDSIADCRDAIQAVIALGPAHGLRREQVVAHACEFGYSNAALDRELDALANEGEVYGVPTSEGHVREWRNTDPEKVVGRFLR